MRETPQKVESDYNLGRNPGGFIVGFAWPSPGVRYVYLGWWLLSIRRTKTPAGGHARRGTASVRPDAAPECEVAAAPPAGQSDGGDRP